MMPATDAKSRVAWRSMRRWPLALIALPAAVSIWAGWVGLGSMCGFGVVHPLPGIAPGIEINTAITLPVGVEAYGAYALGAWLTPGLSAAARGFARRSAIGALILGMLGQGAYHLLVAAHAHRAPWPVIVLVSCLPVITLGFGAALTHLIRPPEPRPVTAHELVAARSRRDPLAMPGYQRSTTGNSRSLVSIDAAKAHYASLLATGCLPSLRCIRAELHVGQTRAQQLRDSFAQHAA